MIRSSSQRRAHQTSSLQALSGFISISSPLSQPVMTLSRLDCPPLRMDCEISSPEISSDWPSPGLQLSCFAWWWWLNVTKLWQWQSWESKAGHGKMKYYLLLSLPAWWWYSPVPFSPPLLEQLPNSCKSPNFKVAQCLNNANLWTNLDGLWWFMRRN